MNWNTVYGQVIRDVLVTISILLLVGLMLFAISGLWPPLFAIESGSMEPNMNTGDLIFVVDGQRFIEEYSHAETGIVTSESGQQHGYQTFDKYGDVIVYQPSGDAHATPIIHRTRFWVTEGENWYKTADSAHLKSDSCAELHACPAPNSGFITLGDNNRYYDQSNEMNISPPVKSSWVLGKAKVRFPGLGWPRLIVF